MLHGKVFEEVESQVRSYCRSWPAVFDRAKGSYLYDENGTPYLDFFAGAGTLNYGHNHPVLKEALLDYIGSDRITHGLDMFTVAKGRFLETFRKSILQPRGLDYRVQFPGPTGANAVEAALKLARKVTGREPVARFTNSFHGMSLGALAVTGNAMKRHGAGVPLPHAITLPFDDYLDGALPDFLWITRLLEDSGSGIDKPAAVIVETVQGEGGINVATAEWLRGLERLCREHEILLIVDDIQMGCGRTGPFFSFERAGITPDIVCLSKSLSGYGLPMSLVLMRPELDIWEPGEHNGTFRGHNPAFLTATKAIELFWSDNDLERSTKEKGLLVERALHDVADEHGGAVRSCGMAHGIAFDDPGAAAKICRAAFDRGLLLETAGPEDEVVKLLPPLTVTTEELATGLETIAESVRSVLGSRDLVGTAKGPM